jgi:hypothetical protein
MGGAVIKTALQTIEWSLTMRTTCVLACLVLTASAAFAQQLANNQVVSIGPWQIATTYKADKFDNCTMSRTVGKLEISFVRTQDGLLLLLESPKWKLERGKTYPVRVATGSQSTEASALAESKGVSIALAERPFAEKLRTASVLEVVAEGATLRVPLDRSTMAPGVVL